MSARGGSHGIHRRSSSLTALSRPSIGVAGQRGAQRVSGAAFDSSVKSSGGNGMMLLCHTYRSCSCWFCKIHACVKRVYTVDTAELQECTITMRSLRTNISGKKTALNLDFSNILIVHKFTA